MRFYFDGIRLQEWNTAQEIQMGSWETIYAMPYEGHPACTPAVLRGFAAMMENARQPTIRT